MIPARKKGRGRPHGTGLNDDRDLAKIAGMIVQTPPLRPTTAIKRVLGAEAHPSTIRRLQVKWKATGAVWLTKAKAVHDKVAAPLPRSAGGPSANTLSHLAKANAVIQAALGIPDASNSRTLDVTRLASANALVQAASGTYENYTSRMFREMHDTPAMRAACGIGDSHTMRALGKFQKEIDLIARGY